MKEKHFLTIAILFAVSLVFSRFMVSVSLFMMTVLALYHAYHEGFSLRDFFKNKSFAGLLLVFIVIVLSGINSENTTEWIHQVKLKLPFLFLPLVFYVMKPISRNTHLWIHIGLILTLIVSTFGVLYGYYMDESGMIHNITRGKSIPTPIDHIHYSIMIAYGVTSSFIYAIISSKKGEKIAFVLCGLWLFAFSHLLAVRTGIVLSYLGTGLTILWYILSHRKYLWGAIATIIMILIPILAYKTMPSLQNKIGYMRYDLTQFYYGKGKNYSDSERIMSFNIALDLIKDQPLIGHGIGDLKPLMVRYHKEKYGDKEKYIYPHNQYLLIAASVGIVGAIIFFVGLFAPLIFAERRNIFLITMFSLMAVSFLVENTVQRAVITAFFLFFILLNLSYEGRKKS